MSAEVLVPPTPPQTPRRTEVLLNNTLSPLSKSPGPFSNLPSFISGDLDNRVEIYDDDVEIDPDEDDDPVISVYPSQPSFASLPLQVTPRATVGLKKSAVNGHPDYPMGEGPITPMSLSPVSTRQRTYNKQNNRRMLPSTPSGSLRLLGFWNTGSPTPSKSNGTQTEIMQSISCMPHRDASPEVRFSISPSCPLTYGCFILRNIVLRLINKLKSPEGYALLMYLWEATASHLRLSPPS